MGATPQQTPIRPPPVERPDPVRVDNLWDIKADPGRISTAAKAWRTFATQARTSHETVDRHAGQLQGDKWAGDTADTYHWHLSKFDHDVDQAAGLAEAVASGLDGAAAVLRRGQDLLTTAWSTIAGAVTASVYHDKVTFQPRDDAQVAQVHAAVQEANAIRADVDHELSVHIATIDRTRSDWRVVAQAWENVAKGTDDGWKLPPESDEDPTFIVSGDDIVLNTGPGNDRVTVRVDPATGEQVVTVNGREFRFPAGSHLTVRAGEGDDSIVVQKGTRVNLTLLGGRGDDNLSGGDGDDTILGLDGKDTVSGGAGNDRISLGASRDPHQGEGDVVERATGGDGDDVIAGSLGRDAASGDSGNDRVFGGEGDDTVTGNDGDDVVVGGGTDNVYGNAGQDQAFGGDGRDYVDGGAGNDVLDGGLGDDTIYGLSGDDRISGGAGNDYLEGATGRDDLDGGLGDDIISGGRDDDTIHGGDGNDTVYTGAGRDHVEGGAGQDKVYGQTEDTSEDVEQTVTVDIKDVGSYIKIEGSPEFVERVQADLDMLRASPRGQLMLGNLQQANDDTKGWFYGSDGLTIKETTDENSYASHNRGWFHNHPAIAYNPSLDTVADGPPVVVLYHEMAHVYDFVHGTTVEGAYNGASGSDRMLDEHGNTVNVPNLERQAVGLPIDDDGRSNTPNRVDPDHPIEYTENGLREEMGAPRRQRYGGP
jgi:Ca2+-binding RTX toxin-like protein